MMRHRSSGRGNPGQYRSQRRCALAVNVKPLNQGVHDDACCFGFWGSATAPIAIIAMGRREKSRTPERKAQAVSGKFTLIFLGGRASWKQPEHVITRDTRNLVIAHANRFSQHGGRMLNERLAHCAYRDAATGQERRICFHQRAITRNDGCCFSDFRRKVLECQNAGRKYNRQFNPFSASARRKKNNGE